MAESTESDSDLDSDQKKKNSSDQKRKRRGGSKWTDDEDTMIVSLVAKYASAHKVKWTEIADMLNASKNGKQCRERWHSHLDPSIKKGKWESDEIRVLGQGHAELGSRWSEIVKRLPGRSANDAKNYFHSARRRCLKKKMNATDGDVNLFMMQGGMSEKQEAGI